MKILRRNILKTIEILEEKVEFSKEKILKEEYYHVFVFIIILLDYLMSYILYQ